MAETKTSTATCMIDSIGTAAGDIWGYLADNGEVTLSKLKKDLKIKDSSAEYAIGWLSREDKVWVEKRGAHTKVGLK